jgi:hypothetical protein
MSTLEQQEVNVLDDQPMANEGFVPGSESIVEDIVNEQSAQDGSGVTQEMVDESATLIDHEAEARKFQSMYDRSQAENARLQQGGQILELLEQRPDLVQVLENGIANPQTQQSNGQTVEKDDFNPWDAFTDENSDSGKYVNQKIESLVNQRLRSALSQQQQQMQADMQMQNTVSELRGTYKMSDNDIQEFLQFTTQPKERVGLNNLVKLWQMQGGQSVANNDTMEAVNAARQVPRSAGVLQGQPHPKAKSHDDAMWDSIVGAGDKGQF